MRKLSYSERFGEDLVEFESCEKEGKCCTCHKFSWVFVELWAWCESECWDSSLFYEKNIVVLKENRKETPVKRLYSFTRSVLIGIFLPDGYPDTVSDDYLEYQIWDTVQASASTIAGILSTHAILKGVGVGDAVATPLAATITWILKDGMGMISRILFAWSKGSALDKNCKQWRLLADIVNDIAMFIEMFLSFECLKSYNMIILCVSSVLKGVVGVAGAGSRAAITQHQATAQNIADVSAKDGSQETCVNLLASLIGLAILPLIEDNAWLLWIVFMAMIFIHLGANAQAVFSLNFKTFNKLRLSIETRHFLQYGKVKGPKIVNKEEIRSNVNEIVLQGRNIILGSSLCRFGAQKLNVGMLNELIELFEVYPFMLLDDDKEKAIHIVLRQGCTPENILAAYFHAHAYAVLYDSDECCDYYVKKNYPKEGIVHDYIQTKWDEFYVQLIKEGWCLDQHLLHVGESRASWKRKSN